MSFLDHIRHANNADLSRYLPYRAEHRTLGWIRRDRLDLLQGWPDAFLIRESEVQLPDCGGFEGRSAALAQATGQLEAMGEIPGWREELYPVTDRFSNPALAAVERAACPFLGIRSWGVHMTGFVKRPDGLYLWIARRSANKPNYPGMLDNMVAGGQPLGLSPLENMIKECEEEASIPDDLAKQIRPTGLLAYCHEVDTGLKPDQMFCFDLELPEDFTPVNMDGEVAEFMLMPAPEVMSIVRESAAFKYNCNLCLIDFFIRHGLITPETEPDYAEICLGLAGLAHQIG
ncbi:NUDIX hydrolase [Aestuariispira insulae]|uniref:Uncharacterized protein DUF4743 n=1 Tax=Aestuariispira insulae TaxID=1461337 RepID=A0A3D9H6G1_9PROT|nr:NUDIX hydrolase family protein [Aestuariispira insulae]RED45088.1 uncharacterized protein DUF4743 [Aestuariispira insulae]